MTRLVQATHQNPLRVVIVGGGVAAVEGLLALRAMAGSLVDVTLVAPEARFVFRPIAVAEPFGLSEPREHDLRALAKDQRAQLVEDSFTGLDSERRVARTARSGELEYDALMLALGARRSEALPGALTFRDSADVGAFRELLRELETGAVVSLALAVPPAVRWPLAAYELVLLTAAHLRARGVRGARLAIATHEPEPLVRFGRRASDAVLKLLRDAGVELHTGYHVEAIEDGALHARGKRPLPAQRVVALPRLDVPALPGVPQGVQGFIPTNDFGKVDGLFRVYAAGDATWFPIKQGGLAAQQADAAAASIAVCAGADVRRRRFRPVLRGVLLTGSAPHYLRSEVGDRDTSSAASSDVLWWPPAKIAGKYLAPYLAHQEELDRTLADLDAPPPDEPGRSAEHAAALDLALAAADADARWGDAATALRWLDVAEQLNVVLPPEYAEKRRRWQAQLPR